MAVSTVAGLSLAVLKYAFKDRGNVDTLNKISNQVEKLDRAGNKISEMSANSLVEFTGIARVEPITAIDASLVPYDFTTDILKMMNSIYAGLYLAAGSMMTDVGDIKTAQLLDKLNPSRNVTFNLANSILLSAATDSIGRASTEGIKEDLTGIAPRLHREDGGEDAGTDNEFDGVDITPVDVIEMEQSLQPIPSLLPVYSPESDNVGFVGMKSGADLTTVANLSVGQTVMLAVGDGPSKRDIPITIRLITYPTNPRVLARILNWSERDTRLSTRMNSWRAGELSFWRDVVLMRDIFAERKAALMQDKSGLFQALTGRVAKNMAAGITSLTPSLGTISSILVISEDTAIQAEQEMYGKLSEFRTRQRIMNATGLMIIAVVNPVDEYVTVYTYSIALPSEFSIKQIKAGTKGSGADISEIVKLIQAGTPPSF